MTKTELILWAGELDFQGVLNPALFLRQRTDPSSPAQLTGDLQKRSKGSAQGEGIEKPWKGFAATGN